VKAALRLERELTVKELLFAWAALAALGVALYLPHVIHGGFYLDDWGNASGVLFDPGGNSFSQVIERYVDFTVFRPVLVLYVPLTYWIFGLHMWIHLAFASFLAIAVAALLYAVARELRLPWVHALVISALVLAYPWFDSTRLWPTGDQVALTTAIALGGLWVALVGLRRDSWKWHVGATALYLLSILTYEITLLVIPAFGLLYLLRGDWARAKWRWAADLVVVAIGGAWNLTHTAHATHGLSGDLEHLRAIVDGGSEILGLTALPVGQVHTTRVLVAIGLVLAAGLISLLIPARVRSEPKGLGMSMPGWLVCAAVGLVLVILGWLIFVPADPYYTPVIWGMSNRVNGIAGIGCVILVYATFGVLGSLLLRLFGRRGVALGLVVTLALGCAVGVGYLTVMRRHIGIWNAAWDAEEVALQKIKHQYPTLRPGTTLFVTNSPANQTLGVPIFGATYDLNAAIKVEYEDAHLTAEPLLPGTGYICGPKTIVQRVLDEKGKPTGAFIAESTYPEARVFNLETDVGYRMYNQAGCDAVMQHIAAGPSTLMSTY
jgi:hypothetical protein